MFLARLYRLRVFIDGRTSCCCFDKQTEWRDRIAGAVVFRLVFVTWVDVPLTWDMSAQGGVVLSISQITALVSIEPTYFEYITRGVPQRSNRETIACDARQ